MLTYDRRAVADALPFDRLIDALDAAFRSGAVVPQRAHHTVEVPGASAGTLLLMPAWQPGEVMGVKIATIFPDNAQRDLPSVNAAYLLFDAHTGQVQAILDGPELTLRRTAAASALASRYLSRTDAATLLMVGTGKLAPHLVAAHATVRPIERVIVWGRRREAAERVCSALAGEPYAVSPADDLESAVGRCDIVSCATLAREPLIRGEWLRAGQHLDLVGAYRPDMQEADAAALARAAVYVDTRAGAFREAGEIVQALAEGRLRESDVVGDLVDLARGTCPLRSGPDDITLFKSVGTALEDLAAAALAADRLRGMPSRPL